MLIIAPPPIGRGVVNTCVAPEMGEGSVEKSEKLAACYEQSAKLLGVHFLDAAGCEFNTVDFMHLTRKGHRQLAELLFQKEVIFAEDVEKIFGKRPWVSRSEEIIEANEANAPKLEDMPEAVKQAQAEHERAKAEAEANHDNKENQDKEEE